MATWAKANPTLAAKSKKKSFNPLMSKTFGYQTGQAPGQKMKKEDFAIQEASKKEKDRDDSYLETDMKKRKKNNEKAIEDMKKQKDDTIPRWMKDDYNLYDVILTYLDENDLMESVEEAEYIMERLDSEQIKFIFEEITGKCPLCNHDPCICVEEDTPPWGN
jgi:hypothetical protein